MKVVNRIAMLSAVIAVTALDASAQTSSYATQTVTFGVRRTQTIILASAQASPISVRESDQVQSSLLKMTVGSYSRSNLIAYRSAKKPARSARSDMNASSPTQYSEDRSLSLSELAQNPSLQDKSESISSDRSVVTLTE